MTGRTAEEIAAQAAWFCEEFGFDGDAPCVVCKQPIDKGDEAGAVQDTRGIWWPNCSVKCADEWYADDDEEVE